jgi:DtxR family Mn-dependent transcriptional regulator
VPFTLQSPRLAIEFLRLFGIANGINSTDATSMIEPYSKAVQDYLKAIHRLGGAERIVSPVDIAARLQVRAPSVTGMLKRMAEAQLIDYEPGKGCKLSELGLREARRVVRRHRLLELFLHRVLGLDWSEVDDEAEALEHAISHRLEQAIAAHLGEPHEDPHGHPIPTAEGLIVARDLLPLSAFQPGQRIVIREVQDDNPERLRRWRELGLTPGAVVTLLGHQPLDDLYELGVDGQVVRLGGDGLAGLQGELADPV